MIQLVSLMTPFMVAFLSKFILKVVRFFFFDHWSLIYTWLTCSSTGRTSTLHDTSDDNIIWRICNHADFSYWRNRTNRTIQFSTRIEFRPFFGIRGYTSASLVYGCCQTFDYTLQNRNGGDVILFCNSDCNNKRFCSHTMFTSQNNQKKKK